MSRFLFLFYALAVLTGSPIFVAVEVLQQAGVDVNRELESGTPNGRGLDALLKDFDTTLKPPSASSREEEIGEQKTRMSEEMERSVHELVDFVFGGRTTLS